VGCGFLEAMEKPDSRAALMARRNALEGHARAIHDAFTGDAFKQDALVVLDALESVRIALDGAPTAGELLTVQRALDGAVILLASLGRST
jgi:hypothetical protein